MDKTAPQARKKKRRSLALPEKKKAELFEHVSMNQLPGNSSAYASPSLLESASFHPVSTACGSANKSFFSSNVEALVNIH